MIGKCKMKWYDEETQIHADYNLIISSFCVNLRKSAFQKFIGL